MQYDLIVVGAGPAGGSAALRAARQGMRVAVIERRALPRHKTCAGGVPPGVARWLDGLDPRPFAECVVRYMHHTFRFGEPVVESMALDDDEEPAELLCVRRETFDYAIVQAAARYGAEVLDGLTVETVQEGDDTVSVQAALRSGKRWKAEASYVIGADGANGIVGRFCRLRPKRLTAIAMEAHLPHRWGTGDPSLRPDTIHLDFGAVPNGYAWVFPNSDRLNIGAGLFRAGPHDTKSLRETLLNAMYRHARMLGIGADWNDTVIHAHPLPLWAGRSRLHSGHARVLLAGDAAALANPLFCDGILNSVRSGRIAADCILTGAADQYTERINDTLGRELKAAARLARIFYGFPRECYHLAIMHPGATRIAARLLNGDLSYHDLAPRLVRRMISAISAT